MFSILENAKWLDNMFQWIFLSKVETFWKYKLYFTVTRKLWVTKRKAISVYYQLLGLFSKECFILTSIISSEMFPYTIDLHKADLPIQ